MLGDGLTRISEVSVQQQQYLPKGMQGCSVSLPGKEITQHAVCWESNGNMLILAGRGAFYTKTWVSFISIYCYLRSWLHNKSWSVHIFGHEWYLP